MRDLFPRLEEEGFSEESPASPRYNCIAWAAEVTHQFWWPRATPFFWPPGVPQTETVDAFFQAFETLGYLRCPDGLLEPGFSKIAFYAIDGRPTHAARQLPDGSWTSKLGRHIDIIHRTLTGLEGPAYGNVVGYMKRPREFGESS